ncbi:MAG: hypothetical protein GC191_18610 [Azospirillum sp.]|nr:hypothetical protein [Azospirillum sp.]
MNEPKIKVARMFEKTSANGRRYFTGRWGGARVLLFKDDRSEVEGEWSMFLQEIPPEQESHGPAAQKPESRGGYQKRSQKPAPAGDPMPNDPLPW